MFCAPALSAPSSLHHCCEGIPGCILVLFREGGFSLGGMDPRSPVRLPDSLHPPLTQLAHHVDSVTLPDILENRMRTMPLIPARDSR